MLIGIDQDNNIKQINNITDTELRVIDVDRENVFGEMSDTRVLNYKYIEFEGGYSIIPSIPLIDIELIEVRQENGILRQQLASVNADLQGFMDFYFSTL
jgi:hypothetical protein